MHSVIAIKMKQIHRLLRHLRLIMILIKSGRSLKRSSKGRFLFEIISLFTYSDYIKIHRQSESIKKHYDKVMGKIMSTHE